MYLDRCLNSPLPWACGYTCHYRLNSMDSYNDAKAVAATGMESIMHYVAHQVQQQICIGACIRFSCDWSAAVSQQAHIYTVDGWSDDGYVWNVWVNGWMCVCVDGLSACSLTTVACACASNERSMCAAGIVLWRAVAYILSNYRSSMGNLELLSIPALCCAHLPASLKSCSAKAYIQRADDAW